MSSTQVYKDGGWLFVADKNGYMTNLSKEQESALREYFLKERDEELGRKRDTGLFWIAYGLFVAVWIFLWAILP